MRKLDDRELDDLIGRKNYRDKRKDNLKDLMTAIFQYVLGHKEES